MKKLITHETPKELINVYKNNWMFHSIVTKHEFEESSYEKMLEDAVVLLDGDITYLKKLVMDYANKYGTLLDDSIGEKK